MSPLDPQLPAAGDPAPGSTPEPAQAIAPEPEPALVARPAYRWYHKMSAVLFITFCLELGFFLLIFPWTDFWDSNFFSTFVPEWHQYWDNMYVRGAVSGLGILDLYVSFAEIFRLRRFVGR
jgi:hypothetical protein